MAKVKHRFSGVNYQQTAKFKVKNKGYFDVKYFYLLLHEWFVEEGWCTRDDSAFPETFYLHKETQKFGKEVKYFWRLEKNPEGPNSLIKYILDVDVMILGLKDAEVMYEGEKYKAHWAEQETTVDAKIIIDPKGEWSKSSFMKQIMHFLWKRIKKKHIDKLKKQLYYEAYRLQEAIKTYYKLPVYSTSVEGQKFWATKDMQ